MRPVKLRQATSIAHCVWSRNTHALIAMQMGLAMSSHSVYFLVSVAIAVNGLCYDRGQFAL